MEELFRRFQQAEGPVPSGVLAVVDVLLVAYLVYRLLRLLRGARAWRVALGVAFFALALFLSDLFRLSTLHWILDKAAVLAPVALVILFLPELRQAVEGFGRIGTWSERLLGMGGGMPASTVEEIVSAVTTMSEEHVGALIVIERGRPLDSIATDGVPIQAVLSAPLLCSIFHPGNPLHDGATVIRRGEIVAAACRLPLSESSLKVGHLRHLAGVGVTEQTDSVCIIVSEERGKVSFAVDGQLRPIANPNELRLALAKELRDHPRGPDKAEVGVEEAS